MPAEMIPVVSTRITEYGYDVETAAVYVRFNEGKVWGYQSVPEWVWDDFVRAPSKGRFIREVLDRYANGPADF
jgi:hypothetical protein